MAEAFRRMCAAVMNVRIRFSASPRAATGETNMFFQRPIQQSWPASTIQAFALRMAGHGFSVSRTMMNRDRGYALEQLRQAHTLADAKLRELAVELFGHFQRDQISATH
jgi:hypothetical protein